MMTYEQLLEANKKRKIWQVAMVTRDLERSMKQWVENLGVGPWRIIDFTEKTVKNYEVDGKPVTEPFKFTLAFTSVGGFEFELIQPVYGPSIYQRFLDEKGEGLHHIKEKVSYEDMAKVVADYKAKGIDVTQTGLFFASVHYYLDTAPVVDVIYELGNCPIQNLPPEMIRYYPPK